MVERVERQHQVLLTMLEKDKPMKAEEFKVSNQNEVLIFLEKKNLITRDWNDSQKKDFKWNYFTSDQRKRAREVLGLKALRHENKEG